jgi:hypothetical protein
MFARMAADWRQCLAGADQAAHPDELPPDQADQVTAESDTDLHG